MRRLLVLGEVCMLWAAAMRETPRGTTLPARADGPPPTDRESPVSSPGLVLESLPAWLLTDIREHRRAVCLDECGVGRGLVTLQRVFGQVPLSGLDASEEAIVEARRRFPDFRFKVATEGHGKSWDVVVHLEAPAARARLLTHLERLCAMARRAVVVVIAHGAIDAGELPLALGEGFVLAHASVTGDAQKWLVAAWALAELPALRLLAAGDALPALSAPGPAGNRGAQLERVEGELSRVRARLSDATRETTAMRELLAEKQVELEHVAREVDALRAQDSELRLELTRMQSSKSWQITRPMREVLGGVRKAQEQASDVFTLAQKLSRDVAQGRAREWVKIARSQGEPKRRAEREPRRVELTPLVSSRPLFAPTLYMFALVPFDDVGGGQRSAQLARVMAARGYQVVYVYLYKKWNVVAGAEEESEVDVPLLTHLHISQVDPQSLLRGAAPSSVAIFEAPHPRYEAFFERAQQIGLRTVFELIDAWDTSLGGDWYKADVMRRFATEADVAVGTARALVKQLERYGRSDVVYLPNAGNESIFDIGKTYSRPAELDATRRAFVYVGSLYGEWFGWDYVRAAARACSDSVFYLIGDPPKGLELPNNVRLLGPRKIDEVPAYLAFADAALLPFIPGRISDAVSPIKIFEYLLMGKRVISTDLPEIRDYPNTTICDSVEAFAHACRTVDVPEAPPESFIMRNTWSHRADSIVAPAQVGRLSVVVIAGESLFEAERCVESLALHGPPHLAEVVWVSPAADDGRVQALRRHWSDLHHVTAAGSTVAEAWAAARDVVTSEVVLFLDERYWLTSRGGLEEALQLLANEASLGAVGATARFVDADTGRSVETSCEWLNDQRGGATGARRDVAYLGARGLFVRRRLLDRLTATALEGGELEGAELSFRVKAAGLEVAGRAFTGLRTPREEGPPVVPVERRDAFLERWKSRRHFFVARRGA